jgi:hypothetical protein
MELLLIHQHPAQCDPESQDTRQEKKGEANQLFCELEAGDNNLSEGLNYGKVLEQRQ